MTLALARIRIADFSRVLAGPYCTQMLADCGADVIKIEHPNGGDGTRQWGPPWVNGHSAYFLSANRNKRSLTLNLKTPEGVAIAQQIIARSDVLVENFLPGTMEALGLGYARLRALNPRLIYCAITGYGQDGPTRDEPGYDFALQAQSGWMSITGPEDGAPHKVGVALVDVIAGLHAANAILVALHHRDRTGQGQFLDVALFDAALASLVNVAHNCFATGEPPARYGNAHPNIVPYQAFAGSDGRYFALAVGNDSQFERLCAVIGQPDLSADARFRTNPARVEHRHALILLLETAFAARPAAEWIALCKAADVPVAPINDVLSAFNEPQAQARQMRQEVDGYTLIGPVARFSETPATIRRAPPRLGEHTDAVLRELGYDDAHIAALREKGVI